jgi:hypothetical protein
MTLETRTTLELKDVKALEFECAKCHTKIAFPITQFSQPPLRCVACDGEQWLIGGSQDWESISRFAKAIQWFVSKPPKGFVLRLELTDSSVSPEAV